MWRAAWAFSGIRSSGERRAPAKLIFFPKNVWASLEKYPKCIETWRQMDSNSKVEATFLFLFFFEVQSREIRVVEFKSILCGCLRYCKNDSAAINKSCIIKLWKNKTEQRHFLLSTSCSELRLDSSPVLRARKSPVDLLWCVQGASTTPQVICFFLFLFLFFKLWLISHISTKACVSCRHVILLSHQVSSPLKGLWAGQRYI